MSGVPTPAYNPQVAQVPVGEIPRIAAIKPAGDPTTMPNRLAPFGPDPMRVDPYAGMLPHAWEPVAPSYGSPDANGWRQARALWRNLASAIHEAYLHPGTAAETATPYGDRLTNYRNIWVDQLYVRPATVSAQISDVTPADAIGAIY